MFITALVKMLPAPKAALVKADNSYYDGLVQEVFEPACSEVGKASIVAFSSISAGAGASFVVQEIASELARYEDGKVAVVDARRLQTITEPELEQWLKLGKAAESGLFWLKNETESYAGGITKPRKIVISRQSDAKFRKECLRLLGKHFKYVLIDCHTVGNSPALTAMAKLVDGIVLVASAGQTRRDEIYRAERIVEAAQGKVLGLILNKRKYPIPGWLYGRI